MALIIKDRVKEITTTTGTGDVSLGGSSATFDAFQSVMSNGDTTFYAIVHTASGTDEWEVGLGTWNTGNTLTRTTVYAGSNGTSAVNFSSGNKDIFMTYPASKAAVAGEDVTFADITATDITSTGTVTLSADPSSSLQAATKQYVDTIAAAGIHYHTPVRVEHPSNLNATYNNGSSGVGATLTNAGTNAALVLDNVNMALNDRVLVANQTDQTQNGVYTVTTVGDGSTAWVLTRSTDTDTAGPSDPDAFGKGDAFFIKEGDTNAGHLDVLTTTGTIVFGTTNIVFSEVAETSIYSAGTGLTLTGTTFSTNQDISTSASPTFNNITVTGTVDGRDVATDGSKLDGIEAGATADQTAAEIKTAYESNSDTNAFTDAEQTKLSGIETGATGDQTASEILTAIKTVDGAASGLDADLLDGQQGSYYLNTGTTFSGDVSGTYNNIVVANDSHTHDGRYYTETEADSRFANVAGDTMSGTLVVGQIDSGNPAAGTDDIRVSGYGILGNRATFYVTNPGTVQIGVGSIHNSDPAMSFTSSQNTSHHTLYEGSNRVFHDGYHPNADKWTTARTLSLSGDASGSVSWDGSANATLSVTVANDSHTHDGRYYTESEADSRFLNVAGDSMSGDLTTTSGDSNGIYIGSGGANITSVSPSNKDVVIQDVAQIRFGGSSWDWNAWAGIAFNDSTEVLTIGGPASSVFSSNASPPNITINFDGLSGSNGLKYENNTIWHAGNDGSGSGLDADTLDGYHLSTTRNSANTVPVRDGNGYLQLGWINTTSGATTSTIDRIYASYDGYIRYVTPATLISQLNLSTTSHNHTYNVNDAWLRDNGDNANVKLYGNSRQMAFRTDGTTEYASGVGGYPFAWMYGGDASGNRIMLLNTSGDLWTSTNGWLSTALSGKLSTSGKAADSELLDGIDSSGFVDSNYSDTLYGNTYTFAGSTNEKIVLEGSPLPYILFKETTTSRAYIQWQRDQDALLFRNMQTDNFDFMPDASTGAVNLRLRGSDNDTWGSVYADDNSPYNRIGFLDGDQNWAYRITTDGVQEWFINNSEYMQLSTTGLSLHQNSNDVLNFSASSTNDARGISFNGRTALSADYNDGWLRLNQLSEFSNGIFTPGNFRADGSIEVGTTIYHQGDSDTYINFATNFITIAAGGHSEITIDSTGVRLGDTGNGYFMPVSGNYGSIQIDAGAHGGYEGYSIGGRAVFMHNNSEGTGLYNDVNNEWLFFAQHNAHSRMYYNGQSRIDATSAGCTVYGDINSTSDLRYKKNIETIDSALEKVQALRGVTFDWDNDAFKEDETTKRPEFQYRATGVIAQDVEKVLPEAVRENEDGFKNVAYGNMVGLLIEAIKEQQEQIDALKKQLNG